MPGGRKKTIELIYSRQKQHLSGPEMVAVRTAIVLGLHFLPWHRWPLRISHVLTRKRKERKLWCYQKLVGLGRGSCLLTHRNLMG